MLIVNPERLKPESVRELVELCPFAAIEDDGQGSIVITDACRLCKLCLKHPSGAVTWFEDDTYEEDFDLAAWSGITVFADYVRDRLHPVSLELLGKARELQASTGNDEPISALLIGHNTETAIQDLIAHGADRVFVFDAPLYEHFTIKPYADAFSQYIDTQKPAVILIGATQLGRSLGPRVATRFETGMTADCTVLEMQGDNELVQIRPAFGGNIMAEILTPKRRPQFCTARYRMFSAMDADPSRTAEIIRMDVPEAADDSSLKFLSLEKMPVGEEISDAKRIVAVGRAFTRQEDLEIARKLAATLGAALACTRPLIENGFFDPRQQIGLSGRTVKPELLITLGISGSVQFMAGMENSDLIIAINEDAEAPIMRLAHHAVVGDLFEIVPAFIEHYEQSLENSKE